MGLTDELCQAASFTQLPKLARYMEGLVDTNLRWEDGLRMATILLRRKALDIDVTMLPVQETEAGFLPEPDGIEEVVRDLFYNPSWQQMPSR